MSFLDIVLMGLKSLWRRKVRSILTILGVVIGTAAIVVMLSLGFGMDESFNRQVREMGSINTITVDPYYFPEDGKGAAVQGKLDDKAVATIAAMEYVDAVTPILQTSMKLVSGKYVTWANVIGINLDTLEAFEFEAAEGRLLQEGDLNSILVGSYVPQQFYNPKARGGGRFGRIMIGGGGSEEPLVNVMTDRLALTFDMSYGEKYASAPGGNTKRPKLYNVTAVGILKEGRDQKDWSVYMDINELKKMIAANKRQQGNQGGSSSRNQQEGYQQVLVKVGNLDKVDDVQDQIKEMGFGAYSLADIRESMKKQARTIQTVLGGIGAISLLVAALGITNTMVMSIYERTREIGIMKVLGCFLKDIRRMFLFEAGMIGFLGGLAGIGFSMLASFLLNKYGAQSMNMGGMMRVPGEESIISIIPFWMFFASVGFATLVGLISGFYPAWRAMKLSALEAIRTE